MNRVLIDGRLQLDLPQDGPSSVESREGRADVQRWFLGPLVVAASVESHDGDPDSAVADAAGVVLAVYRRRPGYARVGRAAPVVPGAVDAMLLDFTWEDREGMAMHSLVLVAADETACAVVHAAAPAAHGAAVEHEAQAVVDSGRFLS